MSGTGPTGAQRGPRSGTVLHTALSFAGAALVLAVIAAYSLLGPYSGTPRRTAFASAAIALAAGGAMVSLSVAVRALVRRRRVAEQLRPGERIVGLYPAEWLDGAGGSLHGDPVVVTLTNQRLAVHDPQVRRAPLLDLEHEDVTAIEGLRTVACSRMRRCVAYSLGLADGRKLRLRFSAGVGLDFLDPCGEYLQPPARQLRALVVAAEGPTPSRPTQPLDTMLVDGEPTVCLLELAENYLRIIGEYSPPMADLYYYFHWEHMRVENSAHPCPEGLPESWRGLRLVFHEDSTLTLCGTEAAVSRLREWAVQAGAKASNGAR
ncbi:MAG: hypothetical protein ACP5KN_04650 [Armatimonadota bacterium]